jgi:hypothetical protein
MTGRNGDTILFTDPNERSRMQGYQDNGMVGYIFSSQQPGTQPLRRLVNHDGSAHFFTTSGQEVEDFRRQGWREEGVVGYIWTDQQ